MDNNTQDSPGNTNDVAGTATGNATGSAPRSTAGSALGSEAASTMANLAPRWVCIARSRKYYPTLNGW